MASPNPITNFSRDADDGFATVTSLCVSVALALMMTAVLIHTQTELIAARKAMARSKAEYALDAFQIIAAEQERRKLQEQQDAGPDLDSRDYSAGLTGSSPEFEATKLFAADAAKLPESWLLALGVQSPQALKQKLANLATGRLTVSTIASLDQAKLWRRCAEDVVSPYGAATPGSSFAGLEQDEITRGLPQVIRLVAVSTDGWRDDRLVRLSPDPKNPLILLDRRFTKDTSHSRACPTPPRIG